MLGCKQGGVWNKKRCLAQENPERAKHVCNQLLGKIRDIKRPEDHSKFNSHLLSPLGCQECLDQVCGSLSPAQCHFSKWGFCIAYLARKEYKSLLLPGVTQGLSSIWQRSFPEWKKASRIYLRKTSFWRKPWGNSKVQRKGKKSRSSWIEVDASQLPASSPAKEC